jgi:hypothetical protein
MPRDNYSIALNFIPLLEQEFSFNVFRREYQAGEKREGDFLNAQRRSLPIDPFKDINDSNNRCDYWASFIPKRGFEPFTCEQDFNHHLTTSFLYQLLEKKCKESIDRANYRLQEGDFRHTISFILERYPEGSEVMVVEPYYLSAERSFGFLLDFEFRKNPGYSFNKKIQQLSLSLDKNFRSNRNFYIDKFERLNIFLKNFHQQLFPLATGDNTYLGVRRKLLEVPADTLDVKKYIFADGKVNNSQFNGVKEVGPLEPIRKDVLFFFIFLEKDRSYALELVKALKGKAYPQTFPGMSAIFDLQFDNSRIRGISLSNFSEQTLKEVISEINSINNVLVIPIITISSKTDVQSIKTYFTAKYLFTNENIPVQFVTLDVLRNSEALKWSVSNIGLQIFSKLGGKPWKVKSESEDCLIIGIGQSHKEVKDGANRRIEKYYAYSVLTDSSGLYLDLEVLSKADREEDYLKELKASLKQIIEKRRGEFSKFVIHTPFKIRHFELDSITELLQSYEADVDANGIEFVVLKVNTNNKFFGYNLRVNSLVPYESSFIRLSAKDYLVWFEGLQYHNPSVYRRFAGPTHIEFHYSNRDIRGSERQYLQDAINLSGANWRGFNAKSLPVSILYCQLVAKFINGFEDIGYSDYEIDNLKPWFL